MLFPRAVGLRTSDANRLEIGMRVIKKITNQLYKVKYFTNIL